MEEELNKKIAEWVGLVYFDGHYYDGDERVGDYNGQMFTHPIWGIARCFKYIVPKLDGWMMISSAVGTLAIVSLDLKNYVGEAETPTLAFCKAVEKLIDNS